MKAVGFTRSLPIDDADSLFLFETERPEPRDHDILVAVRATSVNPVDCKRRIDSATTTPHETPRILGFDAAGVVVAVGDAVTLFAVGDAVWYAGDIGRSGSNAEFQLVDERIAAKKPASLAFAAAAALPLTSLTAWELLFDRMGAEEGGEDGRSLLVIGGAGGVGSVAIQLAKQLTKLNVVATASRPETVAWCRELGADDTVDHRDLVADAATKGYRQFDMIVNFADTAGHWPAMVELIAPQGRIGCIVGTADPVDLGGLMRKSCAFFWELMFTRPAYGTADMIRQHQILARVAAMVDAGTLRTTARETLVGLSAETLKQAHRRIEQGATIGKIVIDYGDAPSAL